MIVRGLPIPSQSRNMPVVNVGSNKRPTYLPSHLCKVRPGQISNIKLEGDLSKRMIKFAVRDPYPNSESITKDGFKTLGLTQANQKLVILLHLDTFRNKFELTEIGDLRNHGG